jgi:hypothetical protein
MRADYQVGRICPALRQLQANGTLPPIVYRSGVKEAAAYASYRLNTSDPLVPPNPKLFESA